MKARCTVRKAYGYTLLAIVFAVLMLTASIFRITFSDGFSANVITLRFSGAGGEAQLLNTLLPVAFALIVIAVCTAICLRLNPKCILIAAGVLLAYSICRYCTDLYLTLHVQQKDFYLITMAHADLALSLLLFAAAALTVFNVVRSPVLLTITALVSGLLALVLTVLQTGSFYADGTAEISSAVFYLSGCMAVALCALTLEWKKPREVPAQAGEEKPQAPLYGCPVPQPGFEWEIGDKDADGTPLYVQRRVYRDAKTGDVLKGALSDVWYPHAPEQFLPEELPLPEEGCVWQRVGKNAAGKEIFAQRRMYYDAATDQMISGELTQQTWCAEEKPQAQPDKVPDEQTAALLRQLENLHSEGILNDEEYREKCRAALNV